jgi:hypothetical protein
MDEEHLLYCPKLDTDQQVLKNTIKLYWDATVTITSPPSAIKTTTTTCLYCIKPIRGKKQFHGL